MQAKVFWDACGFAELAFLICRFRPSVLLCCVTKHDDKHRKPCETFQLLGLPIGDSSLRRLGLRAPREIG